MSYSQIAIALGIGINFFLIFTRNRQWNNFGTGLFLTIPLFIIGLVGVIFYNDYRVHGRTLLFLNIMTPLSLVILDYILKTISIKYQERDFYLIVQGSRYQNNRNYKVSILDHVFTIALLLYVGLINFLTIFLIKDLII